MAKPQLTQEELQAYLKAGKNMIWQYKTLLEIRTYKTGRHYMTEVARKTGPAGSVGITPPGRFMAMTPERAMSFL